MSETSSTSLIHEASQALPDLTRSSQVEQTLRKHLEDHTELDGRMEKSVQALEKTVPELADMVVALEKAALRDRWIFGLLLVIALLSYARS